MMRFAMKASRAWGDALQFGAGHGGAEAILLGVLAALNLVAMVLLTVLPMSLFKIEGEAASQITHAARKVFSQSLDTPIWGGIERISAIATHVALSVLVMRAVTRRQLGYVVLAIVLHATLDGMSVWLVHNQVSTLAIEAFAFGFAACLTLMTFALRDRPPPEKA
jgi:uncharacterized membrane protein YhfC